MTPEQMEVRLQRAETEPLVIARGEGGFKVYSPTNLKAIYIVSPDPDAPTCTCPDYQFNRSDPEWRCKHILAVLRKLSPATAKAETNETEESEERAATQNEDQPSSRRRKATPKHEPGQMVLKRSISPDGRIDSLSVEFSYPVGQLPPEELMTRAAAVLELQTGIVEGFLGSRKPNGGKSQETTIEPTEENNDNAEPAQLIGIGGINGKWGRRLFLTVRVNGRNLRLYGNRKQLAGYLTVAGKPTAEDDVFEGAPLSLRCRVITKPTEDGRFLNVVSVLPPAASR